MSEVELSAIDYEVAEAESCLHSKNGKLLELWLEHRSEDGTASREKLTPALLLPLLGGISVAEPVDDGKDFRFRLVGARNEERLGFKATGRLMSDCYGARMADELIALHNRVLETRKPAILRGRFIGIGLEHALFEALFLPVRNSTGGLQVLAGMYDMSES
ncbi:PAS domain-containing protein [Parvibaculum sp.]|uniref:PAS domain-containing protein n=1 Tax=Parvibaculum sp. TaxID=2024848 RepID=UPI001AFE9FA1|nr:PAS domain-containing protein [Parvibaculum sp.]MBO6634304.1 PAS domain-containing protein [Parvibaculum sp.]MBO6680402.1 PAS domain-containing protein [Parvibaculum sp.]MBO6685947.1 PAS domain-containing protein [Parvibaculum sp.]MBO6906107.1 PAS domain-containing protein [Parvibaculum sp.]